MQASWGHFLGQARKWLKGYLRTRLFGYSVIRGFGYSGIRLFGYWVIRVFGYLRMRLFGSSRERIRIRSIICKFMHYAQFGGVIFVFELRFAIFVFEFGVLGLFPGSGSEMAENEPLEAFWGHFLAWTRKWVKMGLWRFPGGLSWLGLGSG